MTDKEAIDGLMANMPGDLQAHGSFVGCWKDGLIDEDRTRRVAENLLYALCKVREQVGDFDERIARETVA